MRGQQIFSQVCAGSTPVVIVLHPDIAAAAIDNAKKLRSEGGEQLRNRLRSCVAAAA